MKKLTLILLTLLILSGNSFAQEAPMTMARAKALVERPALNPVPSLIPDPNRVSIDTLDTSDPRIKLILCSDGTWHYTKDHDLRKCLQGSDLLQNSGLEGTRGRCGLCRRMKSSLAGRPRLRLRWLH